MSTATHGLTNSGAGGGVQGDLYRPRLLQWLWRETDSQVGVPVSCVGFAEEVSKPAGVVGSVVRRLAQSGLLDVHEPGGEYPTVSFTPGGVRAAREVVRRCSDPVERLLYARRTLLNWAFAPSEEQFRDVEYFFDTQEAYFLGEALTLGEVSDALHYLQKSELIACHGEPLQEGGLVGSRIELTARGVEAVLSGADIGDFVQRMREQQRPSVVVTVNGDVRDSVVAGTITGDLTFQRPLSPEVLARFVRELIPVLAPDSEETREALGDAADTVEHAELMAEGQPAESSRPRFETLRRALEMSPDSMGKQILLQAVGQVMGTLLP